MHGPLKVSYALFANCMPKCQISSGPYGPIFVYLPCVCPKDYFRPQTVSRRAPWNEGLLVVNFKNTEKIEKEILEKSGKCVSLKKKWEL